jgi:magnesium chelatase family protein
MTINEKVVEKENELKALMNDLKNLLNNSYEENKKNPKNYKYLSSLTSSIKQLTMNVLILFLLTSLCNNHSDVALVGGGNHPQPGEISLAHNGVLFLDELPEFKRTALEVLRQPMEDRIVTISRAKFSITFPSSFMLVASMNPCPCGFYNHPEKECVCPPGAVQKYLNKISGPLLDRIDLHVEVVPVNFNELISESKSEKSTNVRERVIKARDIQQERFKAIEGLHSNAQMGGKEVQEICQISDAGRNLLKRAMEKLNLSARAYDRILKVSRTIADLAQSEEIKVEHLAEAIHYRSLDRENWANQG